MDFSFSELNLKLWNATCVNVRGYVGKRSANNDRFSKKQGLPLGQCHTNLHSDISKSLEIPILNSSSHLFHHVWHQMFCPVLQQFACLYRRLHSVCGTNVLLFGAHLKSVNPVSQYTEPMSSQILYTKFIFDHVNIKKKKDFS